MRQCRWAATSSRRWQQDAPVDPRRVRSGTGLSDGGIEALTRLRDSRPKAGSTTSSWRCGWVRFGGIVAEASGCRPSSSRRSTSWKSICATNLSPRHLQKNAEPSCGALLRGLSDHQIASLRAGIGRRGRRAVTASSAWASTRHTRRRTPARRSSKPKPLPQQLRARPRRRNRGGPRRPSAQGADPRSKPNRPGYRVRLQLKRRTKTKSRLASLAAWVGDIHKHPI